MRIAITQRVDVIKDYNETRDALDQRWVELLNCVNIEVVVIPNQLKNVKDYYKRLSLNGLILTGGNDLEVLATKNNVSTARDNVERELFSIAQELNHPILGVCRGMQYLCVLLGENLVKVDGHVREKHMIYFDKGFNLYPNNIIVNSFHEWAPVSLKSKSSLEVIARSKDGVIECVKHKTERIYGIMWHPERETPFSPNDLKFIKHVFKLD